MGTGGGGASGILSAVQANTMVAELMSAYGIGQMPSAVAEAKPAVPTLRDFGPTPPMSQMEDDDYGEDEESIAGYTDIVRGRGGPVTEMGDAEMPVYEAGEGGGAPAGVVVAVPPRATPSGRPMRTAYPEQVLRVEEAIAKWKEGEKAKGNDAVGTLTIGNISGFVKEIYPSYTAEQIKQIAESIRARSRKWALKAKKSAE